MNSVTYNKTKIVATIGPASETEEVVKQLIKAGVDVFRLNFSHGKHQDHLDRLTTIRKVAEDMDVPVAVLQDLQGPKIRVEAMQLTWDEKEQKDKDKGMLLTAGQQFIITIDEVVGNSERASTSYADIINDVQPGHRLMLDDGNIELLALSKTDREITTTVTYGGMLKSRKGINLPDSNVSAPSLSEKDRADLEFGMDNGVDWVALSFVRRASDVDEMRDIINKRFPDPADRPKIVSKIEKPEAIADLEAIIDASDAIMVARGDLGVEMKMEEVPIIQKKMVEMCNVKAKPVIVATQMLESMINSPRPTRAEAGDVANAVIDGADAVMLSAESASGSFPVLAVESMSRIIKEVETKYPKIYDKKYSPAPGSANYVSNMVISSAAYLSENTETKAICALTSSGYTAFQLSSHRPKADIFIFTRRKKLLHQLALVWGVRALYYERKNGTDETINELEKRLVEEKLLGTGDHFLTLAAIPIEKKGRANMIKLHKVEGPKTAESENSGL
ncbi:MAG: pyruvate kinase [Bacteroidota bacterium]